MGLHDIKGILATGLCLVIGNAIFQLRCSNVNVAGHIFELVNVVEVDILVALQLLTRAEVEFPYHGGLRLRDPETGRYCEIDADRVRAGYLRRFAAARERLERALLAAGVEHHRMLIEQPLDRTLWKILRYRQEKAY